MRAEIPVPNNACRTTTRASYHQAVERVIQAMHEQLDEPLSLQAMARIAFVSPYHFNRVFRHIIGIPPCHFLYALRLAAAKRLLLTTPMSVIEICYAVGYNSLGSFTRRFTELVGVPPTQFRYLAQSALTGEPVWPARAAAPTEEPMSVGLTGYVEAPRTFQGEIFIGLFNSSIPQGRPAACASLNHSGPYRLLSVPEGSYYLFAAGMPVSKDPKEFFCYESALRGGGQSIRISNGVVRGSTHLRLRPPDPFDPPILLSFPSLLANHAPIAPADSERPDHGPRPPT